MHGLTGGQYPKLTRIYAWINGQEEEETKTKLEPGKNLESKVKPPYSYVAMIGKHTNAFKQPFWIRIYFVRLNCEPQKTD